MPRNSGSSGGMHYTKSGNLDMRYSSSRAYVASGGSSSGQFSSYSSGSTGGGGLHYTKTGNLDMRYSSSKAAVASSSGFSNSGISSGYSSGGSDLHYTKTGNLDMRYSSSKAAVASGLSGSTSSSCRSTSDGLHFTKTGNLDMRYASSKAAVSAAMGSSRSNSSLNSSVGSSDLHYKKDGSLDMRYKSSQAASSLAAGMQGLRLKSGSKANGIPAHVPLTKNGLPDMRTRVAKDWVAGQKGAFDDAGGLPSWLPKLKDGRIDFKKNVVKAFMNGTASDACRPCDFPAYDPNARQCYYERRCLDSDYMTQMLKSRCEQVEPVQIYTPESFHTLYGNQDQYLKSRSRSAFAGGDSDGRQGLSVTIPQVDYKDFERFFTDSMKLGAGGFGVVYKAEYKGQTVAVKKLLMDKLPKHGKSQFMNEVEIMARFKDHTNLVKLEGYAIEPGCVLVMEYVKLGNLSYLIHHCEDPVIESRISDGRIKKRLVCGIVNGMMHLHAAGIIHRDLKPANVLVTEDYTAKLADFGFSALRGRTASMSARQADEEEDNAVAGTAGYMAPELLDPDVKSSFSIDVYAFGILMNEIIHEEEPYADRYAELHARGPYGAAILAKGGKRPLLDTKRVPANTANLIKMCWSQKPDERPTFGQIATMLASRSKEIEFPDYISLGLGSN